MNKDELQLILEEGEGYRIEFKESMTSIDKELVAFANSSGGRIFLGITDDKEIKGLNITNKFKSQIQDIANLLHRAGYIEKMGTGINKMKRLISKAGLPPIKFEFDTFFTATFRRPKTVEKTVEKILDAIKSNPKITQNELMELIGLTRRGIEWNLAKLKEKEIVKRVGPAKGGYWEIIKK